MNGLTKFKQALLNAATKGKQMSFKDEGGFYIAKLTKDGQPIDPFEMYEFGTLQEFTATSKKQAKEIAKSKGLIAVFDM